MTHVAQADGVGRQWLPTVCKLATEAAAMVAPYLGPASFPMDPRQYFKVKRIGQGKMEDSRVVNGVVFHKSLLHRRM
jgi:1-phosphatidylinositol-3-phosphate 5-kinase